MFRLTLLFLMVACGGDKTENNGHETETGGTSDADSDSDGDTGSAFVPEDIPPPTEWFSGTEILDAVATDGLSEGEAALALLHIMFGLTDRVDPSLLTSSEGESDGSEHVFLREVMGKLNDLPVDEATAIQELMLEITGLEWRAGKSGHGDLEETLELENWCRYKEVADNCVNIMLPVRPGCERGEDGRLSRDASGALIPAGCTVERSAGSVPGEECENKGATYFKPNAWAVLPTMIETAETAWPVFMTELGLTCPEEKANLYVLGSSPASWVGLSLYGAAWGNASECFAFVTSTPPPAPSDAPWLTLTDKTQATTAHELFHCAQWRADATGDAWFIEGTAAWAEDALGDLNWPGVDSEHMYMNNFYSESAFFDRVYAAAMPYMFLEDAGLGYDMVKSGDPLTTLVNSVDFESKWHQASVSTWNAAPVDLWTNDGRSVQGTSKPETTLLTADGGINVMFLGIEPLTYLVDAFEIDETVKVIQLTPTVPSTSRVSAILQGGENERVEELVDGELLRICIEPVGICHDVAEEDLDAIEVLGLIATDVDHQDPVDVQIEIESNAPSLHGTWQTIGMWSSAFSMNYQSGGVLSINEHATPDGFTEQLTGVSVLDMPECISEGGAIGELTSSYDGIGGGLAWGTLSSFTTGGGASYACPLPGGEDLFMSGPTFGLWTMAATGNPWQPIAFEVDESTLTLTSSTLDGVHLFMTLTRISDDP